MLQRLHLKELLKKTAKTTGDLIENKIVGKITSAGKSKKGATETQQNDEVNETQKIYMPPEKCQ